MMIRTDGKYAKGTPRYPQPMRYWGRLCARNVIRRAGNPTRRERRERAVIRDIVRQERPW